jgi:hypothetical protein
MGTSLTQGTCYSDTRNIWREKWMHFEIDVSRSEGSFIWGEKWMLFEIDVSRSERSGFVLFEIPVSRAERKMSRVYGC